MITPFCRTAILVYIKSAGADDPHHKRWAQSYYRRLRTIQKQRVQCEFSRWWTIQSHLPKGNAHRINYTAIIAHDIVAVNRINTIYSICCGGKIKILWLFSRLAWASTLWLERKTGTAFRKSSFGRENPATHAQTQSSAKTQNKLPQKYKIKWRKNTKFDCILRVAAVW